MKWKSHAAVTRAVCRSIGLPDHLERIVIDGAIEPDVHPVKARTGSGPFMRVAHHGRSDRAISILIWKARIAFVQGDEEHGSRHLGRALHYVQDKCVYFGWSLSSHDRLEEEIGTMSVPMEAVGDGMNHSISSPLFVSECVRSIRPMRDAYPSMYEAALVSAALASAVIDGTEAPARLGRELKRSEDIHRFIIMPSAAVSLISIAVISYAASEPVFLLAAPPVIAVAALSMRKYSVTRKVASWYGLDR